MIVLVEKENQVCNVIRGQTLNPLPRDDQTRDF